MNDKTSAGTTPAARYAVWLVLLAAAGAFALTMGVRQTMGLFLSSLNTSTGLGIGSISLAFAFGQLWWGLTQPFAGAVAAWASPRYSFLSIRGKIGFGSAFAAIDVRCRSTTW